MVTSITTDRDEIIAERIAVGRLRTAIITAESAQRGLLLTARPVYRENFVAASDGIGAMIAEARRSTPKGADLDEAVKQIIELGERKLSEMQETVNLLDRGQRESAMALVLSDIGRDQMVDINSRIDTLVRTQNLEMRESGERRDQVLLFTRYSILALVVACLAVALTAIRLIRTRDSERQAYLAALRSERDKLQDRIAENTRALTELALHLQTVREDERSHLARELHDELGGLLTAAKLDLARMRSRLAQAGPEVTERLLHLRSTLDAGIALKRRIIEDLRPSSLANLGLRAALQILCTEWSQRSELKVEIDLQEVTLSPARALAVYRLVQEALTNISKYAQAKQVWVSMQAEAGERVSAWLRYHHPGAAAPGLSFTPSFRLAFRPSRVGALRQPPLEVKPFSAVAHQPQRVLICAASLRKAAQAAQQIGSRGRHQVVAGELIALL